MDPQPIANIGWVLIAGVIGFAGDELVAVYRVRVGRKIGSAAAPGRRRPTRPHRRIHLPRRGRRRPGRPRRFPLADPIVGLLITAAILVVLKGAATDIYRRLMDAVEPQLVDTAESTLRHVPGVTAWTACGCAGSGTSYALRPT